MYEQRMLIRVTRTFVIAADVAFALVRFFGEAQLGRNLESAVGAIAFGAVIPAFLLLRTYAEAAVSLVLTSVALAVGWRFA